MLGDVRPGERRSWWLREALSAEADGGAPLPPLRGTVRADVAILGGGYTGLWTAVRLAELAPGARIVVLERDICGGGPSGRNGGFVTGWWDELPTLVERGGVDRGLAIARAIGNAVTEIGDWCTRNGVDAWYRHAGYMQVSAAPAQDGDWREAVELCARLGAGEEYAELSPDEVQARCRGPVFRGGVFMRAGATVQPARLARGLRRVALERGVTIHERTRAVAFEGQTGPARVRTVSADGPGELVADHVVVGLNAWAAGWRAFGRRLATWSSYIVFTEPVPELLAEIGWTGGEGITDARFALHYARTTPDGRVSIGGGGGRAGYGGRIGEAFTHDVTSMRRAAAGLRRLFPTLADARIEDAWGGPIDVSSDHLPFFGTLPGGRVHFGLGYSGNGVGPSFVGGRILAALALERRDDPILGLPIVDVLPRAFPPEPFRSVGAALFREAIVRRELAEEAGRRPGFLVRELSRLPRRFGYHLGPER